MDAIDLYRVFIIIRLYLLMKKNLVFVSIAVVLIAATFVVYPQRTHNDQFTIWKRQFAKTYDSLEDAYRKVVFMNNLKMFEEHNSNPKNTYKLGTGPFTAMTQAEFELTYLKPKPFNQQWLKSDLTVPQITEDVDWTTKGIVSPVKVMGQCPAGWAFNAVASLQTLGLTKNQTIFLSEQQLIDCTLAYGNLACNDGDSYAALEYVKDHGIQTEDAYPYVQRKEAKCKMVGGPFKIAAWHYVKGCSALASAILERPMGVSVDATNWVHYKSGIFTSCDQTLNVNFDAYLVGATSEYWKLKNAWGTTWGEDGYIRLSHRNTCGMCVDKCTWVA